MGPITSEIRIYNILTIKEYNKLVNILEQYAKGSNYLDGSTTYNIKNGGSVKLNKNMTLSFEGIDEKLKGKLLERIVT